MATIGCVRIPTRLLRTALGIIFLVLISALAWAWYTWPQAALSRFGTLVSDGQLSVATLMVETPFELDNRGLILYSSSGGQRVFASKDTWKETFEGMSRDVRFEPPSILDILTGRRRVRFRKTCEFTAQWGKIRFRWDADIVDLPGVLGLAGDILPDGRSTPDGYTLFPEGTTIEHINSQLVITEPSKGKTTEN